MSVTLINPFVVPADKEDEFLRDWKETAAKLSKASGFRSTRLHRNTGANDRTFLYINVAQWDSEDAYHAAFRDFTPSTRGIPGVKAHPGLFEVIALEGGT